MQVNDLKNNKVHNLSIGGKLYKAGDFKKATEPLTKATEEDINSFKAHYLLVKNYESLQKLNKALKYYKIALTLNNKNAELYFNIARIEKYNENTDEKIKNLEKSLKIKPDFLGAKIMLADTHIEVGQNNKAKRLINDVLQTDTGNVLTKALNDKINK